MPTLRSREQLSKARIKAGFVAALEFREYELVSNIYKQFHESYKNEIPVLFQSKVYTVAEIDESELDKATVWLKSYIPDKLLKECIVNLLN